MARLLQRYHLPRLISNYIFKSHIRCGLLDSVNHLTVRIDVFVVVKAIDVLFN